MRLCHGQAASSQVGNNDTSQAGTPGRFRAGALRSVQSVHMARSPNNRASTQPPTPFDVQFQDHPPMIPKPPRSGSPLVGFAPTLQAHVSWDKTPAGKRMKNLPKLPETSIGRSRMVPAERTKGFDLDSQCARSQNHFSRSCRWFAVFLAFALVNTASAENWRGLPVTPEHRCSPYDKKRDYPYPQSIEQEIVQQLGAIYSPYTGTCFASTTDTDIEHIVATSEAHDSGLCSAHHETRARFARDLRNLTLASPQLNRFKKSGKDAAEWLPARNQCWFAARVVDVRRTYGLTIDRREAEALEKVLSRCESTNLEPVVCR